MFTGRRMGPSKHRRTPTGKRLASRAARQGRNALKCKSETFTLSLPLGATFPTGGCPPVLPFFRIVDNVSQLRFGAESG
jgi:hypothetical protein